MKSISPLPAALIIAAIVLGATAAQAESNELLVSHVQAALDPQTAKVDVWYCLETVDDGPVTVSLFLSTDSGATYPHLCATVSGDVGVGVLPGTGKHIVWDAGADFAGLSSSTCRLRVTADDGRADFVVIEPGTFIMGSPTTEPWRSSDETQHQVTLTHGLYVQTTEVTNQQYRDMAQWAYNNGYVTATSASLRDALDGSTQELLDLDGTCEISFSGDTFTVDAGKEDRPVLDVTWYGSVAYCDWLSLQQGRARAYNHNTWECNAGNPYAAPGYRLPTEAEWEYTCRAGTQTPFNTGSCLDAGTNANYRGSNPYTECPTGPYVGWTMPVRSYPANAFGLYDMHGNLYEWCNDWDGTYGGTVTDPVGVGAGNLRVIRGGHWSADAQYCRSAKRRDAVPYSSTNYIGLRPVRSADTGVPQTGTIDINPEPNSINAPWQVTGPNAFTWPGAGRTTLAYMTPGSYTLTWGAVAGYETPEAATALLAANQTLDFTATYNKIELPFPDSPDRLMANFQTIYEQMDFTEFAKMNHADYIMILKESTYNEFPDLGMTLDVVEEFRIHERMFSKQDVTDPEGVLVPGVQTIQFQTLIRQGSWTTSPANDQIPNAEFALYDAVFLFDRGQNYSTLKVQGAIKFYVTHRDSVVSGVTRPYYQMRGQVDLTGYGKAIESESWGSVKALFR